MCGLGDSGKKAAFRSFLRSLGWFVAGFLAGGVVAFYVLCWIFYGMGHTSHACNTAGAILAIACPVLSILALVLLATGRLSAVLRERRTALIYSLLGFLCGPVSMLLLDGLRGLPHCRSLPHVPPCRAGSF